MKFTQVEKITCTRCNHTWMPRKLVITECPKCQSRKFDLPVVQPKVEG